MLSTTVRRAMLCIRGAMLALHAMPCRRGAMLALHAMPCRRGAMLALHASCNALQQRRNASITDHCVVIA